MANYSAYVVIGGSISGSGATSKSFAYQTRNSALLQAIIKSFSVSLQIPVILQGLSKSTGKVIYKQIDHVLSQSKAYFNNAFSQDSQNIYLSKSALGLPTGLNLSLEALFVALLIQWVNNIGLGDDSKINSQLLANGDKQGDKVYLVIQLTFKKQLTVIDNYETQTSYAISPLDF